MIFTERTITVVNDSATINKPLILYRGDKNIELKITIAESQFKFRNTDASNVIETTDASYAQLVINTPYNSPIFSDVAATKNGAVIFVITEAMIDEIREVGAYEIQIRLLDDNKQSRASIPPVSNAIEIREPIAIEDGSAVDSNVVNVAKVNRALTTTSAPLEAFDSQGNYIKKTWGDGDPITDAALNKMETGIDGVNKKIGNVRSQIKEIMNSDIIQYKGICDGITDETDKLQDVINSLGWNGGVVQLTGEAYILGTDTSLVIPENVELRGMRSTLIKYKKHIINFGKVTDLTFLNYTNTDDYVAVRGGEDENCKYIGCTCTTEIHNCNLPISVSKLSNSNSPQAKIGIFGDSLAAGAGSGRMWWQLLFDQYNASNNDLNLIRQGFPNAPYISDVTNYALGGTTSHNLMMLLGSTREVINSSDYPAQQISGKYNSFSPILAENLDLAIISIGVNGGNYSEAFLERFIKELRKTGTEIILLTANPQKNNIEFATYFPTKYIELAKAYSCEIADTHSYIRNAIDTGVSVDDIYADNIHMAQKGHEIYAKCILDTFKKNLYKKYPVSLYSDRTQYLFQIPNIEIFPNEVIHQFEPKSHNGTKVPLNTSNLNDLTIHKLPIYDRGIDVNGDIVTKLTAGQYADFECDSAIGVDLMVDQRADASVEIWQGDSHKLSDVQLNMAHGMYFPFEGCAFSDYEGNTYMNKPIRVKCISGEVYLIGVSFYSLQRASINEYNKNGTWASKSELNTNVNYSDTIGDYIDFEFNGTGINGLLGYHECAGIIDIYIDGKKYKTIDCYINSPGTLLKHFYIGNLTNKRHYAKIVLSGINSSAISDGNKHRIEIYQLNKLI